LACGQNVFGRGDAACIPLFLFAQSSGPPDAPPSAEAEHKARWKAITADGLLSFSYTYNINDPISRLNQFLMFGFNEDDPQLDGGKTGYPAARQRLHDQRSVYELAGSWKVVPQFVLGTDALYAAEDHAAKDGSDAIWKGVAGYAPSTSLIFVVTLPMPPLS
jgi:hypothetical protein